MLVFIPNTFLHSPPQFPPQLRTVNNHVRRSHDNSNRHNRIFTCRASSSSSSSSSSEEEESRWLREEQRWLREEQRWLREEQRWNDERKSLLTQIQLLQSQLDRIRGHNEYKNFDVGFVVGDDDAYASKMLAKMASLMKGLGNDNRISDKSLDAPVRFDNVVKVVGLQGNEGSEKGVVDAPVRIPENESNEKGVVDASPVRTPDSDSIGKDKDKEKEKVKASVSASLRMGAEGDEVRVLQEALMALGFYSGEEDMEYSSFSEGTARAVKTWQASIGIREDGIMTAELLERLYTSQQVQIFDTSLESDIRKIDEANGALTEVKEVQQAVVKEGLPDVDLNRHRVFLLGENRWEEPSRLNKTKGTTEVSAGKCLTCKGEGRLLCMECDGTGEPNVEEQFLDWVEEAAKCPYCEGLGYNVCDVCHGKLVL